MGEHWFWLALTVAVLGWYSVTTVYVGIRGLLDIRQMLRRLREQSGTGSTGTERRPSGD